MVKLEKWFSLVLISLAFVLPISANGPVITFCNSAPENATGNVTEVLSEGMLMIENLGKIKLADIEILDPQAAKSFLDRTVLGKRVYLYLDEVEDRDPTWDAVAFLYHPNGSVNDSAIINRMLVDLDNGSAAKKQNSDLNNFNPDAWWDDPNTEISKRNLFYCSMITANYTA